MNFVTRSCFILFYKRKNLKQKTNIPQILILPLQLHCDLNLSPANQYFTAVCMMHRASCLTMISLMYPQMTPSNLGHVSGVQSLWCYSLFGKGHKHSTSMGREEYGHLLLFREEFGALWDLQVAGVGEGWMTGPEGLVGVINTLFGSFVSIMGSWWAHPHP